MHHDAGSELVTAHFLSKSALETGLGGKFTFKTKERLLQDSEGTASSRQ